MDILVFSDSHGKSERMKKVIAKSFSSFVVFLGDGVDDIIQIEKNDVSSRIYTYVKGNCDVFSQLPTVKIFEVEGVRFLITHGHMLNVKSGIDTLLQYAEAQNADVVLYGHTHSPNDRTVFNSNNKALKIINPGSIGSYSHPSFASITIKNKQILSNIAEYNEEIYNK